jgi:hypothetical protein
MKTHALYLLLAGMTGLVACGGSTDSGAQTPTTPAGDTQPAPEDPAAATPAEPPLDHGAPSATYPAFKPDMGQLANGGGPVLKNPVVVTITWPNEPNVATFEGFGDQLGPTKYWKEITEEYGVGPTTSGPENHVRMTEAAPSSISDTEIENFVRSHVSAKDATAWPTPATGQPIYIMYVPTSTTLMLEGKAACAQGVGGYHDSVNVNGTNVAYAVIPQCHDLQESTLSASHELAEAATDPYPRSSPGFAHFDDDHLAWEFFQQFQSENGDACEFYRDSEMPATSDFPFTVQRQWSNASAAAGHDPCVPAAHATYFNVTPLKTEDVDLDLSALGGDTATTKGYRVAIGETKKIALGFYSDGPTDAWKIKVLEGGIFGTSQKGKFDMALDVDQGQNGQIAYLTVTALQKGRIGGGLVTVVSTNASGVSHYMPLMIGTPDAKK